MSTSISGSFNLYLSGHMDVSGGIGLYLYGKGFAESSITDTVIALSVSGSNYVTLSGFDDFFGIGSLIYFSSKVPQFRQPGNIPIFDDNGLPVTAWEIFTFHNTTTIDSVVSLVGIDDSTVLSFVQPNSTVMHAEGPSGPTLYASGGPIPFPRAMNLWLDGRPLEHDASVELTVWNNQSGSNDSMPLYVRGSGITDDALPLNRDMVLFLRRAPTEAMPLYIQGPGTVCSGGVNLFADGRDSYEIGTNLVIPSVIGVVMKSSKLYTHGF